jgi:glucosamine--fructose-6-phosphate aminotransferase (isomerizing)
MIDPATRSVVLPKLPFDFAQLSRTTISARGSAFYAGLVGRCWLEAIARMPTDADVASEFRYRTPPLTDGGLGILVSQSGETADTMAALHYLREQGQHVLSIVNVPESRMARASDVVLETIAGPEVSVASTKAFKVQLSVLACLAIAAARARGTISKAEENAMTAALLEVPSRAAEGDWRSASCKPAMCCISAAATASRLRWRVPSSLKRSATSTPKAMRPAR